MNQTIYKSDQTIYETLLSKPNFCLQQTTQEASLVWLLSLVTVHKTKQ